MEPDGAERRLKATGVAVRPRVVLGLVLLAGCSVDDPLPEVRSAERIEVSMVQLLADPGGFDGRAVRVVGFCHLEFEGNALYLHREDAEQLLLKHAIWLSLGWPVPEARRGLSDKYVLVEATFDSRDKGHMDLFAGELRDISRMEAHSSRATMEGMLRNGRPLRESGAGQQ